MVRGLFTLAAVMGAALPAFAQDADLRKEVESLKEKVKALEAEKAAPERDMLDVSDTTILDLLVRDAKVGGFIDAGYIFNMNRPKTGGAGAGGDKDSNRVHIFTEDPNTFYLHNAQLELKRDPTKEVIVGYDVRLMVGSDAAGVDTDPDVNNFGLQQANIQILMPVGDGIMWKIGKFATLAGAEVIESKDNFNYTRSLNFNWAIPFTHTGIRGTYTLAGGKAAVTLGVNNGWDNQVDDNFGKTLEAQLMVAPIEWFSAYLNFYFGDEGLGTPGDDSKRTLIDIVVVIQNIPQLKGFSAQVNVDIGSQDESGIAAGDDAEWMGFSIAGRYQINDIWAGAVRFSMLDDEERFRVAASAGVPGTDGVEYTEFTFTVEARPVKDLIVRAEVRIDQSDDDVFLDGKDADDAQTIFGLEAILTY
jgi:hypothetical protein